MLAIAERRRLARAMSLVEDRAAGWHELVAEAYRQPRDVPIIGITGAPGSGKSTLIDGLAAHWAARGERVAILAIDPVSPFSGGAVLGDRFRMCRSEALDGVFIRSVSAQAHGSGLSGASSDLCRLLAGYGFTRILIETVGIGQGEVDVAQLADCIVVLTVPGLGDALQLSKAGLMEIADIHVVNKADLPGARTLEHDIAAHLALVYPGQPGANPPSSRLPSAAIAHAQGRLRLMDRHGDPTVEAFWHPPATSAIARSPDGVVALADWIGSFLAWLAPSRARSRRLHERADWLLKAALVERLTSQTASDPCRSAAKTEVIELMLRNELDPHAAAERLLNHEAAPDAGRHCTRRTSQ